MARRPDTPCADCGAPLWRGRGSLPTPICRSCRATRRAARRAAIEHRNEVPTLPCAWCAKPFRAQLHYGKRQRYCSCPCAGAGRVEDRSSVVPWASCLHCGGWLVARKGRVRCPRPECERARGRERYRHTFVSVAESNPEVTHRCPECGETFTSRRYSDTRVYCTPLCSARAHKRNRRHRLRAAGPSERFTLREIAERDGWICHLCRLKVSKNDASIDHLVPVSKGGAHTRANVALAHRVCNSARGATGLAQLRLVG